MRIRTRPELAEPKPLGGSRVAVLGPPRVVRAPSFEAAGSGTLASLLRAGQASMWGRRIEYHAPAVAAVLGAQRALVHGAGGLDVQDTTGADGVAAADVPLGHDVGSLVVGGHDFVVLIGELATIDDVAGIQARLNNLGYDCGGEDGQLGPGTSGAIARFQTAQGIAATARSTRRRGRS